ncbi:MAG: succinate dehydrogenase, hydrophobic membrane anchor protein [Pseudomonadales bacterium]
MVKAVTNFGRSGLSDWLVQRVTAVVLLAYALCIGSVLICTPDLGYEAWKATFESTSMKVFSLAAIFSLAAHAWIGMWAVSTDYLIERVLRIKTNDFLASKANLLRWIFQAVCAVVIFYYVVWAVQILWG